jgi:hypothetical protein
MTPPVLAAIGALAALIVLLLLTLFPEEESW